MLHRLGTLCRHSLCAWDETSEESQEETAKSRLDRIDVGRVCTQADHQDQKGHPVAETQGKYAAWQKEAGTIWSSYTGSALVRCRCDTSAAIATDCIQHTGRATAERAPCGFGDVRESSVCRRTEGGRQNEATTSHSQISQTGLQCFGTEKKAIDGSPKSSIQPTQVLEQLPGRIHQEMENLRRRLCQERPITRTESDRGQRGNARGQGEARCRQSSPRQEGCRSPGNRGDLRRHGGGRSRKTGIGGGDPEWHCIDADHARERQSQTERRRGGRARQQKGKSGTGLWLWCHAAFWQARQIDLHEEVCLGQLTGQQTTVMQWQHSILEEENFTTEWKASIMALDLQYELNPMCGTHHDRDFSNMKSKKVQRRISFAEKVELYVGAEEDFYMQRWPKALSQPISNTFILQPHHHMISDEINLMAVPPRREDRRLFGGQEGPQRLTDDHEVAFDPALEDDPHQHLQDEQGEIERSETTESEAGQQIDGTDWHSTLLYALNFQEVPLRLNWNDYEAYHDLVSDALQISRHHLYDTHHVRHRPEDLVRANVEAIIAHRHGDITPGSTLRLVLTDVEFHAVQPLLQPEIVRKVYKLPHYIGRSTLLHSLGLGQYCREPNNQCICWRNQQFLSDRSAALIEIQDGDYFRIAVPPSQEQTCPIGTRLLVTAFHHGLSLDEVLNRRALHQLGWTDTIIQEPAVPITPDFEIQDDVALLQAPVLDERPDFLDINVEDMILQHKSYGEQEPPHFQVQCEAAQRQQNDLQRDIARQPAAVQRLLQHRNGQLHAQQGHPEDGFVIQTWFLSFPFHLRCIQPREVQLGPDFWNWQDIIARVWQDLRDITFPVELHLVSPNPPDFAFTERGHLHVIVLQRSAIDHRAVVLTVLNDRIATGSVYERVALFVPAEANKEEMIESLSLETHCSATSTALPCSFWHGDQLLEHEDRWRLRHGFSFLLILHNYQPQPSDIWNEAESNEVNMMQTAEARGRSSMNPNAVEFRPGCQNAHLHDEFVQDHMKYGMNMPLTAMPTPGQAGLQHGWLITADNDCIARNHELSIYMRILMNGKKISGTHGVITFMKENLLNFM